MKDDYFLAKWLNNELSEKDLKEHLSEEEINAFKKIIAAMAQLESPHSSPEELLHKFKLEKGKKPKVKKLSFSFYLYRVAAVFVLFFASYYFIISSDTNYSTTVAEKINVTLPDNSEVQLNAVSEIQFNKNRWNKNRELELQGEAFFKVSKGSTFTVNTELGKVSVLGTQFNVVIREQYFEVQCYEGSVQVKYLTQTVKLSAGNTFKMLNSKVSLIENSPKKVPSWTRAISSFESIPYHYVIAELERQYNVTVKYDKQLLSNIIFTGHFTHSNLDLALQAVSIPLNLKYTVLNNKVILQNQ